MRSSSGRAVQIRNDLGGEWFLDPVVLIAIIPPATLASVVDLAEPTVPSRIGWTVANLVAFLACALLAAALVRTTRRRRRRAPLPITVTVMAGALFGLIKVLGTAGVGAMFGLTSMDKGSLGGRLVLGSVVGMVAVPAVVLIRATLARHRTEHRLLVAETFAGLLAPALPVGADASQAGDATLGGMLSAEEGATAREEAALVLGELRTALAQAPPSLASELLTEAVEHRLRPLTHRLWSGARLPSSDMTFRGLVRAMLRRPIYPALTPTLIHGVVVTLFAFNRVAPARALATGVVAAAGLAALLVLARTSRPRVESAAAGVAHLVLVLVAAASSALIIRGMLAPEFVLSSAGIVGLMVAWVLPLVLASNVVATVLHDRDAVRTQLVVMLGPEWYAQLMRRHVDAAAARDIADRLHGDLQGSLLAAAARIDRLDKDDDTIRAEMALVGERIERALSGPAGTGRLPLHARLADLEARWAGLLDIRIELDDAGPLGARSEDLIVGIVSEALTNARRHGMARVVDVRVDARREGGGGVRILIDDDGIGPRKGSAGIGSAHLDSVAPGAWSRVRREVGGTRLEVVLARSGGATGLRAGERASATSPHGVA